MQNSSTFGTKLIFAAMTASLLLLALHRQAQRHSDGPKLLLLRQRRRHRSTQGAIPGAKVTLRNVDTNVERVTVSNATGDYFFSSVPPARYTLTFSAPSFQTETISAFEVAVAQAVTINATLQIGDVSETVTVEATGTQVESSTAQLGTVIDEKAVNDLPLNGRNFTQLLTLTPGVTPISTGQNSSASNTAVVAASTTSYSFPSINGAGNRSTIYLVDGMNDNQAWYNTYAVPPIIDTIQEFKINSHNDSAVWRLSRRSRQCRHQVRHKLLPRLRVGVHPQQQLRRQAIHSAAPTLLSPEYLRRPDGRTSQDSPSVQRPQQDLLRDRHRRDALLEGRIDQHSHPDSRATQWRLQQRTRPA